MMTKMHKARTNAITHEINDTINEIQNHINNYDGSKQRLVLSIHSDTDNLELLKLAVCTYLDNSEYKNNYFIDSRSDNFELAFNLKPSINREEFGLMYEHNKYKGMVTFKQFTKKTSLKTSPMKFNPVSFTSKNSTIMQNPVYIFTPLINEMRKDRRASR